MTDDSMPCERCKGDGGTKELHRCPYNTDVNNDPNEVCNCCNNCQNQCTDDI